MGTVIRVNDLTFSASNLPVLPVEYDGVTNGLVKAYQLRRSSALGLVPVAGIAGNASLIGVPSWDANSMSGDGANGIDSGVALGSEFSVYAVFLRPSGINYSYGVGATHSTGGMRLAATSTGWRLQTTFEDGTNGFIESDFAALDALTNDVTRFEFVMATVSATGQIAKMFLPRVGAVVSKAHTKQLQALQTAATVTYAAEKVTSYAGSPCRVVCGGQFNRALTDAEVAQQYASMQRYCSRVGVTI